MSFLIAHEMVMKMYRWRDETGGAVKITARS